MRRADGGGVRDVRRGSPIELAHEVLDRGYTARKVAAAAETYQMGLAPHNPLGPVALHFALATPNFLIQEDMLTDVPWRWDVVRSALCTESGFWLPSDRPGLGDEFRRQRESVSRNAFGDCARIAVCLR